jgi:transposase InsO family protein
MATFHSGSPFEVVGLDYIGPLNPTTRRYRYILTMVDHFSRLTILAPTRQQTAEATVQALIQHWIVYYGEPRIIHTDRGTNFTSQIMAALCARLGVRRTLTTAYRPQADGRVERTNRTVKECLTRLLHEHPTNWDVLLPQVSMAINSTVHDSTGFTPFYLTHGTEMHLPVDLLAALPPPLVRSVPDYVSDLLRRFSTAYDLALQTMSKQATRSKRLYDASARTIFHQVNDKVYYLKKVPAADDNAKFYAPWTGPCTVLDVLSDVNLRISHDTQGWTRVVHVDSVCKIPPVPDAESSSSEDLDVPASPVDVIPASSITSAQLPATTARFHVTSYWPATLPQPSLCQHSGRSTAGLSSIPE